MAPVSTFCSGEVAGGPAVDVQPRYEARVRVGKVEIREAKDAEYLLALLDPDRGLDMDDAPR